MTERVFIVDDNALGATMMKAGLERLGHSVEFTIDPRRALGLAQTFQPSVAVLDIDLPGTDGYALAEALRGIGVQRFIAVTGYGSITDVTRSRDEGFDHHLTKPVDIHDLDRALRVPHIHAPIVTVAPREIQHRMMNSFTVIESLLQLQAATSPAKAELVRAADRVRVIAEAHREGTGVIDAGAYLERVVRAQIDDPVVSWKPRPMEVARAIALGLLVGELLAHARGRVTVVIARDVSITHDGTIENTQIVQALLDQLHATLEVSDGPGTRVRVQIPS